MDINLRDQDKQILRRLGATIGEIGASPENAAKAELWRKLNDLQSERPMVYINEIPWHEMNVNNELTLRCENAWARELETKLRRQIYQWTHMRGDMIVNPFIECPLVIRSTSFGITENVEVVETDKASSVVSRHFNIQISNPEDLEKIKMPVITHDEKATQTHFETMKEIFIGIIPVRKVGQTHIWFTPWDYLVRWWGISEAMMDLIERPDMVHAAVERLTQAWMKELDQLEDQNLLSLDCNNTRIGSGGYGYATGLPGKEFDPLHVKPQNQWGCSNAQIFSEVSPDMHWEFAIAHDLQWLNRFGLSYYGCCEPLDKKIHLLRRIPNLRKISVSPWCNSRNIINEIGSDYVISRKPNPSIFVDALWSETRAQDELMEFLDATHEDSHVELIMKDISTVNYHPERLWQWEKIAMKVVEGW